MITTNKVEAKIDKGPKVSPFVSTKTVDASPKKIKPHQGDEKPDVSLTTQAVGDPVDAAERLKRAEVMEQRANFQRGDTVYQGEDGGLTVKLKDEVTIEKFAEETGIKIVTEEEKPAVKKTAKAKIVKKK